MSTAVLLVAINAFCSVALFGLIWTVQLVHYPAFRFVDRESFVAFEASHQRRISILVIPLMVVELATSVVLVGFRPAMLPGWWTIGGLLVVLFIWGVTFTVQVPLHQQLSRGYDRVAIDRLVRTNAWRTGAWTIRAMLAAGGMGLLLMDSAAGP